jgi:hypothetical protein
MLFRVPASEREEQPYETARWLENYLDLWQRFMRSYWGPHGYPQTSPGFPSKARIQCFEDLEEESDRHMVAMFDARISELEPKHRNAIFYCCGLTHVWPYTEHPADAADEAKAKLADLLRKWTAVP